MQARSPLSVLPQGRVQSSPPSSEASGISVVNPVLRTANPSRGDYPPLTVEMVNKLASSTELENQWLKALESLAHREGTVLDITEDVLGYSDQSELTAVREGVLDVRCSDLFLALERQATWPAVLSLESFLRDGAVAAVNTKTRLGMVKVWCVVVAMNAGEEVIRPVALALELWFGLDVRSLSCSGNGTESIAMVAGMRARAYCEYLWSCVLLAVEEQSNEAFWDWRRTGRLCHVHATARCPTSTWSGAMLSVPHPAGARRSDVNAFCVDSDESDEEGFEELVRADVLKAFNSFAGSGMGSDVGEKLLTRAEAFSRANAARA